KLQACSSLAGYDRTLAEIREQYPTHLHPGTDREESVADYLESIHPTAWTRFGNYVHSDAEAAAIRERWLGVPSYGDPLPLYGTRTTSANEGENNALQWNNARIEGAPSATAIDEEVRSVAKMSVLESSNSSFYVDESKLDAKNNAYTRRHEVNLAEGTCRRCHIREQCQIPCRRILAVLFKRRRDHPITKATLEDLFHPAYLTPSFSRAFEDEQPSVQEEDRVHDEVMNAFGSLLTGAIPKKRRPYHCTTSNQTGHNAVTSPGINVGVELDGIPISPGVYTVGRSPFVELEIDHLYCSCIL
ncbi:hypothetical protein PHYSODRAFT_488299, partial [Phytophthora sojae]